MFSTETLTRFEQIVGMNWIELPAGTFTVRQGNNKISNCQLEVDCE